MVAFAFILPQIKNLPSPLQQRALLEQMVAIRTAEKDRLIREINHRVGNQLQIMSALVRMEKHNADNDKEQRWIVSQGTMSDVIAGLIFEAMEKL